MRERIIRAVLPLALGALFLVAPAGLAGGGEDGVTKELEKLKGTWKVVSVLDKDGNPSDRAPPAGRTWVFGQLGDRHRVMMVSDEAGRPSFSLIKIDPAKSPKRIDLFHWHEGKRDDISGIYELDGDTLKLCYGERRSLVGRPDEFMSVKGKYECIVLKRALPVAKGPVKARPVPEAAVVRSVGDLLSQPALGLPGGKKARLGVEARTVPARGAFLVYALLEDDRLEDGGGDSLGPVMVDVNRAPRKGELVRDLVERARVARLEKRLAGKKHLLFARTVTVDRPGDYLVTFRGPDHAVIATATVTAAEEAPHPWLAFGEGVPPGEKNIKGERLRVYWGLKGHCRAVPLCKGNVPLLIEDGPIPATQALPRWAFEKPDPRLRLTIDRGGLRLESDIDLRRSSRRYLFRLWVNGTPYVPGKKLEDRMREALEVVPGKTLIIDWKLDPAVVGARKGDRVAVQLLYCPDSWKIIRYGEGRAGEAKQARDADGAAPRLPLLTNKVEFVVP